MIKLFVLLGCFFISTVYHTIITRGIDMENCESYGIGKLIKVNWVLVAVLLYIAYSRFI